MTHANGVAERFVRTVRTECLDCLLILGQPHLERVLAVFVNHYNVHRPHRELALTPPHPPSPAFAPATAWGEASFIRRSPVPRWS
jgi:transposase InsO family protein